MSKESKTIELTDEDLNEVTGGLTWTQQVDNDQYIIEIAPGQKFTTSMYSNHTFEVLFVTSSSIYFRDEGTKNSYSEPIVDLQPVFQNVKSIGILIDNNTK